MEVSFSKEALMLRRGSGEVFRGEGILAITKGLLEAGVAYVGGYQGAPVSHLLDVLVQSEDYLAELGVHVEACSNEASAAAMLGASIHYPLRGAVTWKSIVGTNVAADALSNLASPGVTGGALIIVGEDYGEGASVIQERTYAYALKSSLLLFDPRPELGHMVATVANAFALSEASNMPAMLQLRIRACHVRGEFICKDNIAPAVSARLPMADPAAFDYGKLAHPPVTYGQEKRKSDERIPAARRHIVEHRLNEHVGGTRAGLGIVVQGGLYNSLIRALQQFGLADAFGDSDVALLVLNVVYPLVPDEIRAFCADKRAVLVVEEGQPEFIEQEILATLRRHAIDTPVAGKDLLPMAGEYSVEVIARGLARFIAAHASELDIAAGTAWLEATVARRADVATALAKPLPARPPQFCIGCPERPVFSALKLVQQDIGPLHIAGDIGCHAFATFEPFSMGHSILGYGMSLASRAGVSPMLARRTLAVMGDGGFWHNGLITGVQSALFNGDDAVLLIFKNGYTSATGTQDIISTPALSAKAGAEDKAQSLVHENQVIERTLTGLGLQWLRVVDSYDVTKMRATLDEAFTTTFVGLKVIIAEGECQLERQRRFKPWRAGQLRAGKRVVRVKYGVDEDTCSGDHSCIRLSGCPTLSVKPAADPLRVDPVATVLEGCVGCGLCGENAHAATLCPSFYRGEVIQNPGFLDRAAARVRGAVIKMLQPPDAMSTGMATRPLTILIGALGGEGGGVLAEWLVDVAAHAGFVAQSTSIPGVAQRTGATTYYVEVFPLPLAALAGRRPVLSLLPVPGCIDLVVASELLEAGRIMASGMVSPDRTLLIASTSRTLTTAEKMALGDGRFDSDVLLLAAQRASRRAITFDMEAAAREAGTIVSAVMFGAIAGSGVLPFGRADYEAVIDASERGAAASRKGFAAGWAALADGEGSRRQGFSLAAPTPVATNASTDGPDAFNDFPPQVRDIVRLGDARMHDFQDADYAQLYAQRLQRVLAAERAADPATAHGFALTRETARFLALWMAFDDIVRVAGFKIRASRFARVRSEVNAAPADIVRIVDHFKPGMPEVAAMLPEALAARLLRWDRTRQARGKAPLAVALRLRTDNVSGFVALRVLAAMRGWRRRGTRYRDEQALIERWLSAIATVARDDWESANELALCGRLVKGYGSTNERGKRNLLHIVDHLATGGAFGTPMARAAAIRAAREAALADEGGAALDRALLQHGAPARPVIAQPIRWTPRRPAPPARDEVSLLP